MPLHHRRVIALYRFQGVISDYSLEEEPMKIEWPDGPWTFRSALIRKLKSAGQASSINEEPTTAISLHLMVDVEKLYGLPKISEQ